ncbi:LysR family transcriptional regulator [Xanthobacter aminoxidans]|nr:LysR substrate-binding domain-containing protein [Xanthobacter aminoxidans]MCL8382921.1 LysR substrate-binding domain-containing protein [Xanthobacter aminoxidans]
MEIRHLRYFVAMAETGSLMKASERLHVAQPALSVHLANLEAELGTTLVIRSNRGIELTQDGIYLYERAINLLKYHQESINALKEHKATATRVVSIGMVSTMPALLVPALQRAVRTALPDVTLYISDAGSPALYEWLSEGRIDMVMLFNLAEIPELEVVPLFSEAFYVVGASHLSNGDCEIDFDRIVDLPLALPSNSATWRKALDEIAERRGMALNPVLETESMAALKALAMAGDCYTILPGPCILDEVRGGLYHARRIVNPELSGFMSVASLNSRPLGPVQKKVRDILVDVARQVCEAEEANAAAAALASVSRATPSTLLPSNEARYRRLRIA